MKTNLSMVERYKSIDFLKGICILFVIISHYAWSEKERLILLFPFWIDMAVPIFMVISGFVCAKSYMKRKVESISEAYSFKIIADKIIRYSVPFVIAYVFEEIVLRLFGIISGGV